MAKKKPELVKVLNVTLEEHFNATSVMHSYNNILYGLPLVPLFDGVDLGTGAEFEVTVKLLKPGERKLNPWKSK